MNYIILYGISLTSDRLFILISANLTEPKSVRSGFPLSDIRMFYQYKVI